MLAFNQYRGERVWEIVISGLAASVTHPTSKSMP
jgi:hypothetical protein